MGWSGKVIHPGEKLCVWTRGIPGEIGKVDRLRTTKQANSTGGDGGRSRGNRLERVCLDRWGGRGGHCPEPGGRLSARFTEKSSWVETHSVLARH